MMTAREARIRMALNTEAAPVRRSRMAAPGLKIMPMKNSFKNRPRKGLCCTAIYGRLGAVQVDDFRPRGCNYLLRYSINKLFLHDYFARNNISVTDYALAAWKGCKR